MKKLLLAYLALIGTLISAQVSYTQDWTATGLNGWTTSGSVFSRNSTASQICGSTGGTIRGERYYGNTGQFTSPVLTGNNQGTVSMSFDYKVTNYSSSTTATPAANIGSIKVEYASSTSGPWTTVYTIDPTNHVSANTCATKTITFNPVAGDFYVRFNVTSDANADVYYYFDNVNISQGATPTCFVPTGVTTSNATLNSVDVSWTAPASVPGSGYEYYYSTSNTDPTAATTASGTATTTTTHLSGLTPNTTYYVWVRSVCSASDKSAWSNSGTFRTGYCLPTAGSSSTSYYLKTISTTGALTNLNYSASAYAAYTDNTATSFSSYPGGTFNYSLANSNTSTCYFYIWVDFNNDLDFNDAGETMLATTTYAASTSGTLTVPVGQALGSYRARIALSESGAITACGPAPYGNYVDFTFNVNAAPSCIAPTGITTSNVTLNSVDVSWTAPASVPGSGYEYYYSTSNTDPTAATTASGTATTTTTHLSGLTPNTTYYVWVRSVCSASDKSAWSNSGTFRTGYCLPTAGSSSTSYYLKTISTTGALTNLNYSASAYAAYTDNTATSFSSYPGGTFNYSLANSNTSTCYFYIWVDFNNDLDFNDAGETMLATTTYAASTSGTLTVPVGQALGSYRARIALSESGAITACGPAPYGNYVDFTFNVTAAPSCVAPTSLTVANVALSSADVSWTAPASVPSSGYEYYYSTSNTDPVGSGTSTNNLTETLSSLTQNTTYYVWVRSNCGSSTSVWVGPISFTTLVTPPANDNCSGAIPLTVGGVFADNALTTSNVGATTDGTTSCQSNRGDNVWFSVIVPASGNVTVETKGVSGSGLLDTVLSAHSGTCGSLTSIACNDDNSSGVYSLVSLTGQTPGSTLYFSVWRYTGTAGGVSTNGQFQISAYDSSLVLATNEVKDAKNSIKVYPNPFNDVLNISDASNVKNVLVSDLSGRLLKTIANPGSQLQLGELKQGMYLVTLEMKDGSKQTIKAIKK
ncbi:Por secretion system C-terminal sorting domain-containing protein [Chryseobacterium taichungense]|uniref:Por secretion system C-terminal sorting domain-containing protein n=1 Tax=Chryseobacterium taichungense TaxID=295069 RepID=A0A1H7Y7K5_9FLAO|nr:GEVED domain-containing protein [Chryseobacterium taichungense]SEM41891.1 Por secretion system C-terminal sorting domain-containing protein [Chryseobacterium taichungense]